MKKLLLLLLAASMICALLPGCRPVQDLPDEPSGEENAAGQPDESEPEPEPEPEPVTLHIAAVGDNLLHNTVSYDFETEDGGFDFTPLYANIAPFLRRADVAFINQEVPLAGEVGAYPMLSAPTQVAAALKESGFSVVNLASNHSLDKGRQGLLTSIEAVRAQGFDAVLGCFASQEQQQEPAIVEKQGVKLGFLSYTYGTNGIPVPEDAPYLVSLIDEEKIQSDMQALRPQCDVLIVSLHWGNEYQTEPSDSQRALAQKVADWGADVIIGHHPHVLQPVEFLTRAGGGQTLCAYSLGNFVSGQHQMDTMLGGLLWCELSVVPETGEISFGTAGVLPLVTHYEGKARDFDIIPLCDYTPELAEKHGIVNFDFAADVQYFEDLAVRVLGTRVLTAEDLS